jgi:hypothetical protein
MLFVWVFRKYLALFRNHHRKADQTLRRLQRPSVRFGGWERPVAFVCMWAAQVSEIKFLLIRLRCLPSSVNSGAVNEVFMTFVLYKAGGFKC